MNTRLLTPEFEYLAPVTLQEALTVLAEKEQVKILAGGTDLIVKLKTNTLTDIQVMLDIKRIGELDYISFDEANHCLRIGALAKLSHIEKHPAVIEKYPALVAALKQIASISVRNMGTMVGNICNASPVADSVIPAICYGAHVVLISLGGTRQVDLTDFFLSPGVSVMNKDEILKEVVIPAPKNDTGGAFVKKTRVGSDIAKISVVAVIQRDRNKVKTCKLAMAAIAATPAYLKDVGDSMVGKEMSEELLRKTALLAAQTIKPISDNRTTAEYRTDVSEIVTYDVLKEAWLNAGGELV